MEREKSTIEQLIEEQRDLAVAALKNVELTMNEQQLREANDFINELNNKLAEFYKPRVPVEIRGDQLLAQEMDRLKKERIH